MDSKLILDEYLLLLKSTVEVYVHGTLESSNEDVKELLRNSLLEIMESQEETYNLMVSYGYYKVKNIEDSVIKKTLKEIKKG